MLKVRMKKTAKPQAIINLIGYLQVSKACRSLVYVSLGPRLWGDAKHDNGVPVTLTTDGRLTA